MLRNFHGSLGVKDFELGVVGLGLTSSCDLSRCPIVPPAAHAVTAANNEKGSSCAGVCGGPKPDRDLKSRWRELPIAMPNPARRTHTGPGARDSRPQTRLPTKNPQRFTLLLLPALYHQRRQCRWLGAETERSEHEILSQRHTSLSDSVGKQRDHNQSAADIFCRTIEVPRIRTILAH